MNLDLQLEWFWTGVKEDFSGGRNKASNVVEWEGARAEKGEVALGILLGEQGKNPPLSLMTSSPRNLLLPFLDRWAVTPSLTAARVARTIHLQIVLRQLQPDVDFLLPHLSLCRRHAPELPWLPRGSLRRPRFLDLLRPKV